MNFQSALSMVIAMLTSLISAGSLMRYGWMRHDWFPVFIGANLAWLAIIYILVLIKVMPYENYPAWVRPSAAFVFLSFALIVKRGRL